MSIRKVPCTIPVLICFGTLGVMPACLRPPEQTPATAPIPAAPIASAQAPVLSPFRIFGATQAAEQPSTLTVTVDAGKTLRTVNKRNFLGTNIAIWNAAATYLDTEVRQQFSDAGIGLIRLPGGSASDQYFWNGHGVRKGNVVDRGKYKDGQWTIDYSQWEPGFMGFFGFPKDAMKGELNSWQGNSNVKEQLDFVKALGADTLVTVNAGTGTPKDAAQWVKWANQTMKYGVKYWEVGNELGGGWEAGTLRADGKTMDGPMYGDIYRSFAKAIKAADPKVLVGSQGGIDFIKGALGHPDAPIDFVTYHDYFSSEASSPEAMFKTLDKIKPAIQEVKDVVRKLRPQKDVLVGMTEFNSQLFESAQTSDLNSGLWLAAALVEMMAGGLDFATQWDSFTQKKDKGGGHGFMIESGAVPKAEYWTYVILNRYFGDRLLEVDGKNPLVRSYASKDASGNLYVLAVNISQSAGFAVDIQVKGAAVAPVAECARFSEREYAWDPVAFATPWNSGPRFLMARVNGGKLELPRASLLACRLALASRVARIDVLGQSSLTFAPGSRTQVEVLASDVEGRARPQVAVTAQVPTGYAVEPAQVKTAQDGLARFTVTAPASIGEGRLRFIADGSPAVELKLSTVDAELVLSGPSKMELGGTASMIGAARYRIGSHYALVDTFNAPATVEAPGISPLEIAFQGGLAFFSMASMKAISGHPVQIRAANLSSKTDITFFEQMTKEKISFRFDDDQSLKHVAGKLPFHINPNVRPNEGVLEIQLKGAEGWTQDVVDLEKLNELPDLDRANITAISFDLGVDEAFDAGGKYADIVVVLQSEANYWMPLDKFDLRSLPKGQFKRVTLPIKPEFQKAMKAFFKIVTVVNSGAKLNGAVYIDNLGFVVKSEK